MKKLIFISLLFLSAYTCIGQNSWSRLSVSLNYGANRSNWKNPSKYGIDTITDQWNRLVSARVSPRYGLGVHYRFYKNFTISTGFNIEERGWFRDSLPMWPNIFAPSSIYVRGEYIHRFMSFPIDFSYRFGKKIKFETNIGLVIGKRIKLGSKYNKNMVVIQKVCYLLSL